MPGLTTSEEIEMEFEPEDGAPEMDFQVLEDGQEAPEDKEKDPLEGKKVLSSEEYQELLRGRDSSDKLNEGFGKIAEVLASQRQPVNAPVQQQEVSEEDLERMLFQPGQSMQAIRQMLVKELAPVQGATVQQQIQMNKRLMKLDPKTGELFSKYETDIEKKVQGLPPQVRFRADVYEMAYREVLVDKQEEIIQEKAAAIAAKAVEEALASAGIKTKPPALRQEVGSLGAPRPKKTVYLTGEDVRRMRDMMLDPSDPDQKKAYYERYKKGRS